MLMGVLRMTNVQVVLSSNSRCNVLRAKWHYQTIKGTFAPFAQATSERLDRSFVSPSHPHTALTPADGGHDDAATCPTPSHTRYGRMFEGILDIGKHRTVYRLESGIVVQHNTGSGASVLRIVLDGRPRMAGVGGRDDRRPGSPVHTVAGSGVSMFGDGTGMASVSNPSPTASSASLAQEPTRNKVPLARAECLDSDAENSEKNTQITRQTTQTVRQIISPAVYVTPRIPSGEAQVGYRDETPPFPRTPRLCDDETPREDITVLM